MSSVVKMSLEKTRPAASLLDGPGGIKVAVWPLPVFYHTGAASQIRQQTVVFTASNKCLFCVLTRFAASGRIRGHELNSPLYFSLFALPGYERWYSFDSGPAHFVVLGVVFSIYDAERLTAQVGDMNDLHFPDGSFDVIWSEGAIFIIGFAKGLA